MAEQQKNQNSTILSNDDLEGYKAVAQEALMGATESDFLKWAAVFGWFDSGEKTVCPKAAIPTVAGLMNFLDNPDLKELKEDGQGLTVWGDDASELVAFFNHTGTKDSDQIEGDLPVVGLGDMLGKAVGLKIRGYNAVVLTEWLLSGAIRADNVEWLGAVLFQAHQAWVKARKNGFTGDHPLKRAAMVLLKSRTLPAKRYPTAIMPRFAGSVIEVAYTDVEAGSVLQPQEVEGAFDALNNQPDLFPPPERRLPLIIPRVEGVKEDRPPGPGLAGNSDTSRILPCHDRL